MGKVKWIKITTDIFNDEKIQLIEAMPEADAIIVIWFKLLALAGKSNHDGLIMISDKVPYTREMLTVIFRRKQTVIDLALKILEDLCMIEKLSNDAILIANWDKHQNVKGLSDIKEQNRLRQQKYRDKQKNLLLEDKTKDKEQDKELDLDIESNVTDNVTSNERIPYKEIIDYLNLKVKGTYRHTTKKTQALIKARWNEGFTLDDFMAAIDNTYAFRMEKGGDLTYVRPVTIFNGDFENRVNGTAFGFKKEEPIQENIFEDRYKKKE